MIVVSYMDHQWKGEERREEGSRGVRGGIGDSGGV